MKTIGITAEYNPLHIGHAHQLSLLADRWPEALRVIIMSGAFVQRGTPAFFHKFDRARWALLAGADLVFELPALFALRSAEGFAAGSIRLMDRLGLDAFAFGSEITNMDLLMTTASLLASPAVQDRCRELMQEGAFYGEALRRSITELYPPAAAVTNAPNALLGIEYLRALSTYDAGLTPLVMERRGSHHSTSIDRHTPSGTALRRLLLEKPARELHASFPEDVAPLLAASMDRGAYLDADRYEELLLYNARRLTSAELQKFGDFGEGIENRWKRGSLLPTWSQARSHIKSKRYSYARLDRMGAYTLLNFQKELLNRSHREGPLYARLLGFTEAGRDWLRGNEASIPIVQKWAPFLRSAKGLTRDMALADMTASDMQSLCFHSPAARSAGEDLTYTPFFLK